MPATGKDADSNADMNFNLFKDKIDPLALVHYGGGVTDNASAAAKERNLTFDKVMKSAKGIENPNPSFPIKGDFVFGVKRLIVDLGDGFHIDNLAVTHAINKAFGETERGEHSQCHHRQAMQSLGDCHKIDPVRSQQAMNDVLEGTDYKIELAGMKENQIRWLQNGRNSIKLLTMIGMETVRGNSCLMEYGTKLCNTGKSPIQRRIAREIATWFSMPTIIAAYHFEDELTAYFEITMGFNSSHGEMSPNPGFRMMELQLFFHEFVQPWWNCVR